MTRETAGVSKWARVRSIWIHHGLCHNHSLDCSGMSLNLNVIKWIHWDSFIHCPDISGPCVHLLTASVASIHMTPKHWVPRSQQALLDSLEFVFNLRSFFLSGALIPERELLATTSCILKQIGHVWTSFLLVSTARYLNASSGRCRGDTYWARKTKAGVIWGVIWKS